jgi:predicted TIM-barrel fold metal-dependent hydrolase
MASGIIDCHAHVASQEFIPLSFIEGAAGNVVRALAAQGLSVTRRQLLDRWLAGLQDGDCDELVEEMNASGIAESVLLLPDFTFALKDCKLSISEAVERHRVILNRRPDRFRVFAGVDPRWGRDGVDLFHRAVTEYGFHGLKLYPPCGYSPSDRSLFPFYEICAQYRLPVLTHTGPTSPVLAFDVARPILADEAARTFPDINFILAHGHGTYVEECIALCACRPNVYLDVSGFQTMPVESLRPLFSRGINHKILFGTDWPLFRVQGRQQAFVESLSREPSPVAALRPREADAFFGGTIHKLLCQTPPREVSAT